MKNRVVANKRILVANRGEIATRIFRAATELNMRTIGIYSHEDRFSVHRFKADEAYKIGEQGDPVGSYLNWKAIIALAKEKKVDAIHPGYGFLSENPEFAEACERSGIMFCGPASSILELFGDKLKAKEVALAANIPSIPGGEEPCVSIKEAVSLAETIGYPITLKALSGGGGKGIRIVKDEAQLKGEFERAQSEALTSFGKADVYLEKNIQNPRHIEVQIAGDSSGQFIHLYERDCSIQRRHQKVVEIAPSINLSEDAREKLFKYATDIAAHVNYVGIGTVEFLVDDKENIYFLEVNPRIQVEHTVTEMVTGIDLVQMSILLAAGRTLQHPAIGITKQSDVKAKGVAIQCRITTENPQKDFAPDTGVILAYRPAQGFGIRLDEGLGTSGGLVTPHYDSLLVKVTAYSFDLYGAARKMARALKEFRIRGVKTNIPLLINIMNHNRFLEGSVDTSFLAIEKDLYKFPQSQDRATRLLKFISNVTINNPHGLPEKDFRPQAGHYDISKRKSKRDSDNAKSVFDKDGVEGLKSWIKSSNRILLTDTTMRDAHQSLFAPRLRNIDIYGATEFYKENLQNLFSVEMWGGATFDTCFRFLKEDPWDRLASLREALPNHLLQMLFRGSNAVGYTNYPSWVIKDFIRLTAESGLDLFRIFDCLNNSDQMKLAIEEVKKHGSIAESCICYTGNILDPSKTKYDLKYYIDLAKKLEVMGSDIICIKDMAGLLRPKAAKVLVTELKNAIDLPIHLHTHATSGSSDAMLLAAAEVGCDIVDGAMSSMSGLTSQPSLNALVASLEGENNCPDVELEDLDEASRYWASIRKKYMAFDPGLKATSTEVYKHEIPGGQYSNLYNQAQKVGVTDSEFHELTLRYMEVNDLFGDIVKVTPSSKVVGDMALLLQKNNLTGPEFLDQKPNLDYPDSVISFFKGEMGVPYGGFNTEVQDIVLGKHKDLTSIAAVDDDSLSVTKEELETKIGRPITEREAISYRLYPKVWLDYTKHVKEYGAIEKVPTDIFFYGIEPNKEIEIHIEPGKTLYISLSGITEPDTNGNRRLFFQLNGFPRALEIVDETATSSSISREKADTFNPNHIGAPMPGKIIEIKAQKGSQVKEGDSILVMEAMKMEYIITAKASGTLSSISVQVGDLINESDLLAIIS